VLLLANLEIDKKRVVAIYSLRWQIDGAAL